MPQTDPPYRSLRTQIALVFGGFSVFLAVVLCLLAGEFLKWRLQQQAATALHIVASNTATMLQQDLQQQSRRAQVLATSKELWEQGLASRGVADMLARMQHINPHNVWIGVADVHGTVQNATDHLLQGTDVSQRPWFQYAQSGPFISQVYTSQQLTQLLQKSADASAQALRVVDFAAPIQGPDGSLLGVLGIHSSWDWARDAVERLQQGAAKNNQQSIFIFDKAGTLIYAPDGATAPYTRLEQTLPEAMERNSPNANLVQWKDRAQPFLTSAVQLPTPSPANDLGWWIVARQPVEAAYADANRMLWLSLGFAGIAGLLTALVAWTLARHVSDDLKQLAQAASQIQAHTHASIPLLHSNREVFKLSQALSGMTAQLLRANEEMQKQVHRRTQELQAANAELQRQANTDALTQLLNRRGFDTQATLALALARRSGRPLSMISLDIDFFKSVNDQFGHDAGDSVLANLADILRQRTRQADIVARIGGEEFALLLPDTSASAAQ
ncbi:diguanylate cyclase, partial [Comamonas sp.]